MTCFFFQVEILALLCVDHEDQSIRDSSLQNMQKIFAELRQEDEEGGNKVPEWVVELAHAKIFDVSKIVSAPSYMDNLFHEEKTLERHLASLHGFLLMLKSIEDARYVIHTILLHAGYPFCSFLLKCFVLNFLQYFKGSII